MPLDIAEGISQDLSLSLFWWWVYPVYIVCHRECDHRSILHQCRLTTLSHPASHCCCQFFWCHTIFFHIEFHFFVKTYWFDETEEFSIASDANGYYWGNVTRLWRVPRWKHECTCRRGGSSIAMTPFLFLRETELSLLSPAHTTTLMHPHGHKKIEQWVSRSRDCVWINQKWDLSLYGFCANMEVTQDEKSFLGRLLIVQKMFVE